MYTYVSIRKFARFFGSSTHFKNPRIQYLNPHCWSLITKTFPHFPTDHPIATIMVFSISYPSYPSSPCGVHTLSSLSHIFPLFCTSKLLFWGCSHTLYTHPMAGQCPPIGGGPRSARAPALLRKTRMATPSGRELPTHFRSWKLMVNIWLICIYIIYIYI